MAVICSWWLRDSESFDELRTNGKSREMIERIPFMLRFSKHDTPFFSDLLKSRILCRSKT